MRGKVAKAIRKECAKREMTPRGYRYVKDKYTRLQPILEEIEKDVKKEYNGRLWMAKVTKLKWISVATQKKRILCPS